MAPRIDDSELKRELAAVGAEIEEGPGEEEEIEVPLFAENVSAIEVYFAMSTQWEVAGMGSVIGMKYSALDFVMTTLGIRRKRECFAKIRILESEHLAVLKERQPNGSKT